MTGTVAGASDSLTYTLANSGTEAETIVGTPLLIAKSNCTVTLKTAPAASIGVSGSTTAVISVTPVAAGAWSFTVAITDSDPTDNPYTWTVSGTAAASSGSALSVSRASTVIGPQGTDVVSGSLVATPDILTYVLTNDGIAAETTIGTPALGSLTNCTATLTTAPTGTLAVSASRLRRDFSAHHGESMVRYLNRIRVDRAKELLAHSPLSLRQIAGRCGFSSEQYLCAVFARLERMPPGAFRATRSPR